MSEKVARAMLATLARAGGQGRRSLRVENAGLPRVYAGTDAGLWESFYQPLNNLTPFL